MEFKRGDIVSLKTGVLGQPPGTLGYVYEEYTIGKTHKGVSVITENGENLGGYGQEEYGMLEYVGHSDVNYKWKNAIQLDMDFEQQIKPVFEKFKVKL